MNITIFGLTISSSWGNGHATPYRAILRALHRGGHRVSFFEKDVEYYARCRDFTSCPYCDLTLYTSWSDIRVPALRQAAASDAVIVASYAPDGARIADEVLQLDRPLRVFYDLDTPITLQGLAAAAPQYPAGPGSGGVLPYLRREQIPGFDLYLSFTGGRILRELEQTWGARMARPLYGCVDPDVHGRVPARPEFGCALSYMGTYAADRQQQFDTLFLAAVRRRPAATFVLAGSMYPHQWSWPANLRRFEHVVPAEHPALYSSSRLTLNLTRDGMARYGYCPSGRFFEAAACATPLITDLWEGLETFFAPGEELFVARTTEDILAALSCTDDDLTHVAARARQRSLDEHTGDCRAQQMLDYFDEAWTAKSSSHLEAATVRTTRN